MAIDYLPIQASAVPCERIFLSSTQMDTSRRNRIKPELMEALQMLKFGLKKWPLDFTGGWMTDELSLTPDACEEQMAAQDLLGELLQDSVEGVLDSIVMVLADED
jgi:hypothetical protein